MTRAEHLEWAKERARYYLERGQVADAWGSLCSDFLKHDELRRHSGLELGARLILAGHLTTARAVGEFIDGFN